MNAMNKTPLKHLKPVTFSLLLLLVAGLLFILVSGWQGRCNVVWVKLIWRWGRPDQSIGSGLIVHHYDLSNRCTAKVLLLDKILISFEENGKIWTELAFSKQLTYFFIDWGKWLLLVAIAMAVIVWWFLKRKQRITNEASEHG